MVNGRQKGVEFSVEGRKVSDRGKWGCGSEENNIQNWEEMEQRIYVDVDFMEGRLPIVRIQTFVPLT